MQYGPGFLSTFLYYFTATAVITIFAASKAFSLGVYTGLPQQLGLVLGIMGGLAGGYFNRTVDFSVPFKNRNEFLSNLDRTMTALGYEKTSQEEDLLIYQRIAMARFLSGKVFVQLEPKQATVASRLIQVRKLRKQIE